MKIEIPLIKIYSYQTLVYKNGRNTYKKEIYHAYQKEIGMYLGKLQKIKTNDPISVKLHFKCKNKTVGDLDNITKPVLDTLQAYGAIKDDRYIVELVLTKTFNHESNSLVIEIERK